MSAVVGVAWTVYGIIAIALGLFSVGFTQYYQSKRESERSATLVTTLLIAVSLWTVALLPIDIFLVSSTVDSETGLKKKWADGDTIYWMTLTVQTVYYILYGLILAFLFFLVPYAYFYHQAEGERKKMHATKYTTFFLLVLGFLFFFGLFLKPNVLPPHIDLEWFRYLLTESHGAKAVWFVIACLWIPSMFVFIIYTAPGLSLLPFYLIKHKRTIDTEDEDVHRRLEIVRRQQQEIEQKYAGSDVALSTHDYRTLENLNDEERILTRRLNGIEEDKASFFQRVLKCLRPFEVFIGLILIVFILLMSFSMVMTIFDKIFFSVCGRRCGFIISQTTLFNPINFMMVHLQKVFPLDAIIMISMVLYFLLATMTGMIQTGVRCLWVTLYRIKKRSTKPQALLFSSLVLTFGLFAINYSMTSIVTPGYAHFGSQVYCNHTEGGRRDCSLEIDKIVPCDIYAPLEICTPTVSSMLIDRMTINTPLFGLILYYSQWAFLASFLIGFVIALFKSSDAYSEHHHDEEEEEEAGLLEEHHHSTYV
ncbi:hypothetical protein EDC96DRAFT_579812 [Choanephora cucurbitarum]|nr:hypothetical protein EDC96DRAFT_579812 [Choanephora cucurbitarum]